MFQFFAVPNCGNYELNILKLSCTRAISNFILTSFIHFPVISSFRPNCSFFLITYPFYFLNISLLNSPSTPAAINWKKHRRLDHCEENSRELKEMLEKNFMKLAKCEKWFGALLKSKSVGEVSLPMLHPYDGTKW